MTRFICTRFSEEVVSIIDRLVERGLYSSRSDVVRTAVREFLGRYLAGDGGVG